MKVISKVLKCNTTNLTKMQLQLEFEYEECS